MRILYISCHEILEFDEVKLLKELGHYVFSPGAYLEPRNRGDENLRPGLDFDYDPADVDAWQAMPVPVGVDGKSCLTREFVSRFDAVIVMHIPNWISDNWDAFKGTTVIWRTIGQSIQHNEEFLEPYRDQGLKIVRYSPRERTNPSFIGEDAMIRFYKDPEEYKGWTGQIERVLTVNQSIHQRADACNYFLYESVTGPLPRTLMGPGNDGVEGWVGKVPFGMMKQAMRDHRCYFYVGTHPASYTLNFCESFLSGIPTVAIGPKFGNAHYFPGHNLYEIPDFIENGVNGFISDNPTELTDYLTELLADHVLAAEIGAAGRETAIKLFAKEPIKVQWNNFLNTL